MFIFLEIILQSREYSFVESCFGGHLLIFRGYSYRRKSITAERTYWFCCKAKCPAKGVLHSDGKFQMTNFQHNHQPDIEDIRKKERLVELKKLALQLDVSGHDLLEALDIRDNIKKHLRFIRTCRSRDKKQRSSQTNDPVYVGLNYKRLGSRITSKEMILHLGYVFRQDSVNRNKESCKYWRCRVKNCKARAKTDEAGNMTILRSGHIHPPDEREETCTQQNQVLHTQSLTLNKAVSDIFDQRNVRNKTLNKYIRKLRKNVESQVNEVANAKEECVPVIEEPHLNFCPSAPESENFSLDKLMAETLGENYCGAPDFVEPLNLLKN